MAPASDRNSGPPSEAEPLSVAFANTLFAVRGRLRDGLRAPAAVTGWLRDHPAASVGSGPMTTAGSITDPGDGLDAVSDHDLTVLVTLRDAIRSLFRSEIDAQPPDATAIAVLNKAAAMAPPWPELVREHGGYRAELHRSGGPVKGALGALATDAVQLLAGDRRQLLRACRGPGCVQFYVQDHPRRAWCSPSCGNRARVARHYARVQTSELARRSRQPGRPEGRRS
jgi:predicted RNA-binding Zn ribbon-like protein